MQNRLVEITQIKIIHHGYVSDSLFSSGGASMTKISGCMVVSKAPRGKYGVN